jgi:hypothetical protein
VEDVFTAIVPFEGKESGSLAFSRTGFYIVSQVEIEFGAVITPSLVKSAFL